MISRSQTEQLWPWSPASPSMFSGKTRIMSLESVSTPSCPPVPTQSLSSALALPSAQEWAKSSGPLGGLVSASLPPREALNPCLHSWKLAGPWGPREGGT